MEANPRIGLASRRDNFLSRNFLEESREQQVAEAGQLITWDSHWQSIGFMQATASG